MRPVAPPGADPMTMAADPRRRASSSRPVPLWRCMPMSVRTPRSSRSAANCGRDGVDRLAGGLLEIGVPLDVDPSRPRCAPRLGTDVREDGDGDDAAGERDAQGCRVTAAGIRGGADDELGHPTSRRCTSRGRATSSPTTLASGAPAGDGFEEASCPSP